MKNIFYILLLSVFAIACNDDETPIENEEELITTVILSLSENGTAGNTIQFKFTDLDGDGGNAPVIETDNLASNTSYSAEIMLLNESVMPVEDITTEIEEEDADHQFFFSVSDAMLEIAYDDADGNGNPVGLQSTFTTGDAGTGNMTLTLRHEPDKNAEGVSEGDISNAGGETDIEIVFPIVIQ